MLWVKADASDFRGALPRPRSGHTSVNVGKSLLVVFGGLADRKFLTDLCVYDLENKIWFTPVCTGSGPDGTIGPCPRAFHVAVSIDCHMFIFGGRSGGKRLGDFWMLDTEIWQWSELSSYGDLPCSRDFASASAIGNRKIVMYGGSDGKKWLSDVYILDTISLEWTELSISGPVPPSRCGHTVTMVEKRLLVYGGRGAGGQIMGDLWALKGLIEEENETPGWTQLKLPGQSPSPRCGHTMTSGGHYLLLFGGHGIGGWLSRYDIYHNECIVLDRVSVQWKRLSASNEPPARAYHSLNCIGSRHLLFGGFDGKSTFGDLWWLVPEDDPIAKRLESPHASVPSTTASESGYLSTSLKQDQRDEDSSLVKLQKQLRVSISSSRSEVNVVDENEDKELLDLAMKLAGEGFSSTPPPASIEALREYWKKSTASSIRLRELGPLLRDYKRLIIQKTEVSNTPDIMSSYIGQRYSFFHVKNHSQLRMDDIPKLLSEYKQLGST